MTDNRLPVGRPDTTPALDALPGLVRLAATSWVRTAEWGTVATSKGARSLARAVSSPSNAMEFAQNVVSASSVVADLARAVSTGVPIPQAVVEVSAQIGSTSKNGAAKAAALAEADSAETLRRQGEQLLQRSRDVWNNDQGHPAYARILTELAPDEARILMLLLKDGPQGAVDVRTGGAIGMVSSRLLKSNLTMIGPRAGCRYLDQVPSYLHNLARLGMIWFSREQLSEPIRYQVIEAQPDVLALVHSVRKAKIVRRSIHLTPFGEDFCRAVLVGGHELDGLPEHDDPPAHEIEPPKAH